jgi:hypothetical protein
MKTMITLIRPRSGCAARFAARWDGLLLLVLLMSATVGPCAAELTIFGQASGDVNYAWNSKYGPYGYTQGATDIGVGLTFGAPYGNDYTMGIIEIPITELQAATLTSVALKVYSNGFGTGYDYGSAGLRWLNPGAMALTGDPQADGLGPVLGSNSNEYQLWSSYVGEPAGWYSFDVTTHVMDDLTAGREFSTFVLNGSRDTGGSIRTAEYGGGFGPQLVAVVPEPQVWALALAAAGCFLIRRRYLHRRFGPE